MLGFPRKINRKTAVEWSKTTAVAKYCGFGRQPIFSTEGSFGYTFPCDGRVAIYPKSGGHMTTPPLGKVHRLARPQNGVGTKKLFWVTKFCYEKCSDFFPIFWGFYFVGPNYPVIFPPNVKGEKPTPKCFNHPPQ